MTHSTAISRKEPWLAVILSTLCPGIGQIYAGQLARGFILIIVALGLVGYGGWLIFNPTGNIALGIQFIIAHILVIIFNLFDTYRLVKKQNDPEFERQRKSEKDPWLAVFLSRFIPGLGHAYQGQWLFAILFFVVIIGVKIISGTSIIFYGISLLLSYLCFYHVYTYCPIQREKSQSLIIKVCLIILLVELLSVSLAFSLKTFIAEARYIPSESMLPTLQINDRLIVDKLSYRSQSPQRQDIIVFNAPEALKQQNFTGALIYRIIGLPRETVEVKAQQIYINHQPLSEDYILEPPQEDFPATQVPPQSYFVLGDNRNNAFDSRYWGVVPQDYIIGKATKIFWPPARSGVIP